MAHIKISMYDNIEKIVSLCGLDTTDQSVRAKCLYNNKQLYVNIKEVKQNQLEEAYETYKADLENNQLKPFRDGKVEIIGVRAFDFIESRYPIRSQQLFQALFTEAVALGYANRITYIKQLLDWCKSVLQYTEYLESQLELLDNAADISSFSFDFSNFEETDPKVTLQAAAAIEN